MSIEAEWNQTVRAGSTHLYTGDCITTDKANFNGTTPFHPHANPWFRIAAHPAFANYSF